MAYRFWTARERKQASLMRERDHTDAEIAEAIGRSETAVSVYLRRNDLSGAEVRRKRTAERLTLLRRAYPRWIAGESIPSLMRDLGWTASRQAMWQALRAYQRSLGRQSG